MVCTAGLVVQPKASSLLATFSSPVIRRDMSKNFFFIEFEPNRLTEFEGDSSAGVPPVPIPNTDVKPCSADGTALVVE